MFSILTRDPVVLYLYLMIMMEVKSAGHTLLEGSTVGKLSSQIVID